MRRFINKIIDRIQRKRAIRNHRKMWHWLAENPGKSKIEFLLEHDEYDGELLNNCYLCDYADRAAMDLFPTCMFCPLDWNGKECNEPRSLFQQWNNYRYDPDGSKEVVAGLALQIAELPEKVEK